MNLLRTLLATLFVAAVIAFSDNWMTLIPGSGHDALADGLSVFFFTAAGAAAAALIDTITASSIRAVAVRWAVAVVVGVALAMVSWGELGDGGLNLGFTAFMMGLAGAGAVSGIAVGSAVRAIWSARSPR